MNRKTLISPRAANLQSSAIDGVLRLCVETQAINLAIGAPEQHAPDEFKQAAVRALLDDENQYTDSWGYGPLRAAIAEKLLRHQGARIDPETRITVTCGTTEAMLLALMALHDTDDEVIVFEPFFDNYIPAIRLSGAVPRFVPLRPPKWEIDEQELKGAFNRRTKSIIVNNPSNPSGKVFTRGELQLIAKLCQQWDALCITDEIYEHMVFDGREHISMLQVDGMPSRTVMISGLSKTYVLTGWRIGYVIAPETVTEAIRHLHGFTTYCAPAPLQAAAANILRVPDDYYGRVCRDVEKRRDFLTGMLEKCGFICHQPQGAVYLMADISRFGFATDVDFTRFLVKEIGVGAVPGGAFYASPEARTDMVRFCFWRSDATLNAAEARLAKLANCPSMR